MKRTLTNILMLLAVPLILMPIVMGAGEALEAQRREHAWQMRREHLYRQSVDRHNRIERERRRDEELQKEATQKQLPRAQHSPQATP